MDTMGIMSAALGLRLLGVSYGMPGTDTGRSGKPTRDKKRTARRMTLMVAAINRDELRRPPGRDVLDVPSRPRSFRVTMPTHRHGVRRAASWKPTTIVPAVESRRAVGRSDSRQISAGARRRRAAGEQSPASSRQARAKASGDLAAAATVQIFAKAPDQRATIIKFAGDIGRQDAHPDLQRPHRMGVGAARRRAAICARRKRARRRQDRRAAGLPRADQESSHAAARRSSRPTSTDADVHVVQGNGPRRPRRDVVFRQGIGPARADGALWHLTDRPSAHSGGFLGCTGTCQARASRCRIDGRLAG